MRSERSLLYSYELTTAVYPEPAESSPQLHTLFLILSITIHVRLGLLSGLFPSYFQTKVLNLFLISPVVLHAPTSPSFISSP
jgi:hypothetical protein